MATALFPAFDVYATPFVPYSLKAVNELPAIYIQSMPPRCIDMDAYVSSFAGSDLLRADPPPAYHKIFEESSLEDNPDNFVRVPRPADYQPHFHGLLTEEVAALRTEAKSHALYKVALVKAPRDSRPEMYHLLVPGLREASLRIEVGDTVHLRQLYLDPGGKIINAVTSSKQESAPNTVQYDASVWSIDRQHETLLLNVTDLMPWTMLFNVCFCIQHDRLRSLYRSIANTHKALQIDKSSWMRTMLFPQESDGELQHKLNKVHTSFPLQDEQLNYEQIRAIETVLDGKYGRLPYLISGPPGTGKTKTLVELAFQLLAARSDSHLLVCAPSDSAADTLIQRLRKFLGPSQLLRLQSPSRSFPEVNEMVLPFCYVDTDIFALPPFAQMMRYRIVVTTCRDAELLLRARLTNSDLISLQQGLMLALRPEETFPLPTCHWTALLMDEAAQAIEPEALIPILVVAPPQDCEAVEVLVPVVVMAGDQYQLGPRTASRAPTLQISLFERLLKSPLYCDHPLARSSSKNRGVLQTLTQEMLPIVRPPFANLIRNYRSHPAILAIPSALFYNDTLEPEATKTESLLLWRGWKSERTWPVLFVQNKGTDELEREGGGWVNATEANTAVHFALSVVIAKLAAPKDICIIAPFSAQVKLLRKRARHSQHSEHNLRNLNIGPLEAFQGLESKLVILCTTRTRDRFIDQDVKKGLGVMHEPQRLNVALTRAKEGLIVIGNTDLLETDPHWRSFLAFCYRNKLWKGKGWTYSENNHVITRIEKQLLHRERVAHNAVSMGVRSLGLGHVEDTLCEDGHAVAAALQEQDDEEYVTEAEAGDEQDAVDKAVELLAHDMVSSLEC